MDQLYRLSGRRDNWTEEEKKLVVDMYMAGETMSVIGGKLHRTKNSIVGLLNRLRAKKLIGERMIAKAPKARRQKLKTVEADSKPKKPTQVAAKAEIGPPKQHKVRLRLVEKGNVTFSDLEYHQCRWPFGDPRRSDFRFCGHSRSGKGPYCDKHTAIAGRHYETRKDGEDHRKPRAV
jgi:GcrA cell cycle regulator